MITGLTSADDVVPRVLPATRARHYVVESQVLRLCPTVLAAIAVPDEYFATRQFPAVKWALDHVVQPNDDRLFDEIICAVKVFAGLANRLGLTFSKQRDSPPHVAYV
jgi:hypothetical protein